MQYVYHPPEGCSHIVWSHDLRTTAGDCVAVQDEAAVTVTAERALQVDTTLLAAISVTSTLIHICGEDKNGKFAADRYYTHIFSGFSVAYIYYTGERTLYVCGAHQHKICHHWPVQSHCYSYRRKSQRYWYKTSGSFHCCWHTR